MEVLGTVVHHLRDGETTLRPFLFIGIISATRGILAVGARLSVSDSLTPTDFIHEMVELGVNAVVIIALGITMNLIGKFLEEGAIPRHKVGKITGKQSRSGRSPAPQAASAGASTMISGLVTRGLFVLMALIILVALALIALLVSLGRL
jgi:hypothetical protein